MPAIANVTCQNATTPDPKDVAKDDLNALLYIVVTLLFYSMGIIIGIITYLKREQAEMEEDKMFDMYMQLKREPFNLYKKERVNQMALYLKQLEEQREARERVENWRTAESQQGGQQHHPACRQHSGRLHSPFLPGAEAWPGLVPLAGHDPEWGETGGGAALLCSLTLGVCEPLLTPDTIKRVAFPDAPNNDTEPKSLCSYTAHQGTQQRCQCGSIKSAFKGGSGVKPAGHDKRGHQSAEHIYHSSAGGNSSQHYTDALLALTQLDSAKSICDIKDRDTRQMGEAATVFHNCSPCAGADAYSCDRNSAEKDSEPGLSPRQRSLSLTAPQLDYMQISRQLSLDLERKLSDLAVHSSSKTTAPVIEDIGAKTMCTKIGENFPNATESLHQELPTETCSECKELERATTTHFCGPKDDTSLAGSSTNHEHEITEIAKSPSTGQSSASSSLPLSPIALTQSVLYQIPVIEQPLRITDQPVPISLPLALFQLHSHVDVRPKVFPLRDIPKSLSLEDSSDPQNSDNAPQVPASKRRLHNAMYDTWKKGNSKTVDIPDIMQRSQPSPDNSLKPSVHYAKRSLPRIQPARDNERRGALFFTQKSLHKDDSPKSGSAIHRHAKSMGLVGRQESVDSSNSRTSELSDSPLLRPNSESTIALNLSSNSSSAGSTSMSPPTVSKQQGRIPRLSRSQTVDSSKLLKK